MREHVGVVQALRRPVEARARLGLEVRLGGAVRGVGQVVAVHVGDDAAGIADVAQQHVQHAAVDVAQRAVFLVGDAAADDDGGGAQRKGLAVDHRGGAEIGVRHQIVGYLADLRRGNGAVRFGPFRREVLERFFEGLERRLAGDAVYVILTEQSRISERRIVPSLGGVGRRIPDHRLAVFAANVIAVGVDQVGRVGPVLDERLVEAVLYFVQHAVHPRVHERQVAAQARGHPFPARGLHGGARAHRDVLQAAADAVCEGARIATGQARVVAHRFSQDDQVIAVDDVVVHRRERGERVAAAVVDGAHLALCGAGVGCAERMGPQADPQSGMAAFVRGEAVHLHQLADVGVVAFPDLLGCDVEGLVPGYLNPAGVDLHALLGIGALHGRFDAVRVVHVHDGALAARAQRSGVVRAIGVALDVHDHAVLHGGDEAAAAAQHAHAAMAVHLALFAGVGRVAGGFGERLHGLAGQRPAQRGACGQGPGAFDEAPPCQFHGVQAHVSSSSLVRTLCWCWSFRCSPFLLRWLPSGAFFAFERTGPGGSSSRKTARVEFGLCRRTWDARFRQCVARPPVKPMARV